MKRDHTTLHLLPRSRWEAWRAAPVGERYAPDAYPVDGFIHCTDGADELIAVANRYYAGDPTPFVAVSIDLAVLDVPWRYDVPGSPYPHIYGTLPAAAITAVAPVVRAADGRFQAVGPARPVDRSQSSDSTRTGPLGRGG